MRPTHVLVAALALAVGPRAADAFCGFYVGGSDARLTNNATMVVLMRDGTRTVMSMQNNYQGPPADFAMVVPVPVVLGEDDVKTLPPDVFDRIDKLSSPRLVEYWEQDPCNPHANDVELESMQLAGAVADAPDEDRAGDLGVTVEARFDVAEYQIVILSANDSTGLDTWLRREHYQIPPGAEPLLRPYVQQGMKFFVAKVDARKVKFIAGQAMLSPLRFHYDASQFNLPIRLGLVNSGGTQDLIVHILAPGLRYEVANYDNVTIPTNLNVKDETRQSFARFYAALFDATVAKHPGAVVTEYAWTAATCDPCPSPPLDPSDLVTLGGDVLGASDPSGFVLTRLHARYGKDVLGDDLVFRPAPAIVGGREFMREGGVLERGAVVDAENNFQARYVIRHPWDGPIACATPQRNVWGGPPGGGEPPIEPAQALAFAPRDAALGSFLAQDVAELDYKVSGGDKAVHFVPGGIPRHGCAGCAGSGGAGALGGGLLALGTLALVQRRRRR